MLNLTKLTDVYYTQKMRVQETYYVWLYPS